MRAAIFATASLLLAAALHAQMAETIEVRITNVDVVVTDRKGNPVHGLTRDDFEVFEGGKPQAITNFYEISDAADPSAQAASDAVPPEIGQRRIVVFVDNYSINPLDRNQAFVALERALSTLMRPGDEAMLVFWGGGREMILPFTSSREELVAKLRDATARGAGAISIDIVRSRILEEASRMLAIARTDPRTITIREAYERALTSARAHAEELYAAERGLLEGLSRTLEKLGGLEGKKALIFLGAEMPETPGLELFQQLDSMFQFDLKDINPAVVREKGRTLRSELHRLGQHANANGVTLYLVDTADRQRRADPSGGMVAPDASFSSETNTPLAMGGIAAMTGGIAVPGGKSFELALGTVARDLSSYYSLGYRSPEGEGDRRVKVTVKKPGLRVRARGTYVAKKPEEEINARVIANVFRESVKSDFPVSVEAQPWERTADGYFKVRVTVTLPSTLTLIPQDDALTGEFAVYFVTGDAAGSLSPVTKAVQPMKFPANARPALEAQKTLPYRALLLVRPGEQLISVAVVDTLAGTTGFARTKVVAQ